MLLPLNIRKTKYVKISRFFISPNVISIRRFTPCWRKGVTISRLFVLSVVAKKEMDLALVPAGIAAVRIYNYKSTNERLPKHQNPTILSTNCT
jgi:hypothetical protein